jgi:molybdopterin converting factor subunit 1
MKTIHVQYFAMLREERGCSAETLQTEAGTARDLYEELRKHHGFRLPHEKVKAAVNDTVADWHTVLNHGDVVAFLPPFAGG